MTWQAWLAADMGEVEEANSILRARQEHPNLYRMNGSCRYYLFSQVPDNQTFIEFAWPDWR